MNALREYYESEIVNAMIKKFSYKNKMEVPKIEKVVINMGLGEAKENAKAVRDEVKKRINKKIEKIFAQRYQTRQEFSHLRTFPS